MRLHKPTQTPYKTYTFNYFIQTSLKVYTLHEIIAVL